MFIRGYSISFSHFSSDAGRADRRRGIFFSLFLSYGLGASRDGWNRTDVGPIEVGWRQVGFQTRGQSLGQSQSRVSIALSPTRVEQVAV